jgi:phage terminase large subunit GpA-like protein
MINKPDIMEFLKAIGVETLPHEAEPYGVFDGPAHPVSMVILKSRQMRGTEFGKNIALFHLAGRGNKFENVLHVFPRSETASRYVHHRLIPALTKPYTYLNEQLGDGAAIKISNITFKHDGHYFTYAGTSADALRGISVDLLVRDEVGELALGAVQNTDVSTSASTHPAVLDIGTPRGNNVLKTLWQQSDMREYFYCCIECYEYFQPTMELLCGITDVGCPSCGREQDKLKAAVEGKWVQMRNPKYSGRIGFHFTQLINPKIETIQLMRWREELSAERFRAEILGCY